MSGTPAILLIDDGELGSVADMLERLHVDYTRVRGGLIEGELPPPTDLLIATPRRAAIVRRGSPAGASLGRPLRIVAADEDSKAMRRMVRRMGFHLLVRRGAHPDVWRLLIERAMFDGDDRREEERLLVGANVSLTTTPNAGTPNEPATLVDISNRGCRLRSPTWLAPGSRLSLEIALPEPEGGTLRVTGHLVRSTMNAGGSAGASCSAGMLFDEDQPLAERERLGRLLNDLSMGPGVLTPVDPQSLPECESLPECDSAVIPGLTLDAETDPALPAGLAIGLRRAEDGENRRNTPRGRFVRRLLARSHADPSAAQHVLMGRDLSAGGMRIEPCEGVSTGHEFELAIYGPGEPHPFLVRASVERDEGEAGLALRFMRVSPEVARGLEKVVACLPDIESLEEGERGGLGAVISEILSRTPIEER